MAEQIKLIAERIKSLREILELSAEEVAKGAGMTVSEYTKYENGETDFSFSLLHNIAKFLGIDVADLITGDNAKLSHYILTRAGGGYSIQRNNAYDYKHLALNFRNKLIQPFCVTLSPDKPDAVKSTNTHAGQEFDYVLEGTLKIVLENQELILNPGDSLFYDSSTPHAMYALNDKPASFLAVVTE